MVVMILEAVPPALRGDLTRWLVALAPTVFVGRVSAAVRDGLWLRAIRRSDTGRVIQAWRTPSEQGFDFRLHNAPDLQRAEFDGIVLTSLQDAAWQEAAKRFRLDLAPVHEQSGTASNNAQE
jgi:CRISPR-associated protein Cas2